VRHIIFACLTACVLLWPLRAETKEFERGEAVFSVQSSLLRTDTDFFKNNQSENDFILNFRQDTVDFGRLETDIVTSNIETRWKLGSFRAGVKDIWFGMSTHADFNVGDVYLDYRTIPSLFTNFILPVAPMRSFSLRVGGDKWFAKAFAGWFTNRDGFLGNAYTRQNEFGFGFNFGFEIPNDGFIGGGFIRTEKERTDSGELINSSNNIFLLDSRLGVFKNFSILSEFLYSYYNTAADGHKRDHILIVGPSYEAPDRLSVKANYRYMGRNFYYLSRSYQTINNQEGVYAFADFRSPELFYIYGSSDFYWMRPAPGFSTSLIYNWVGNIGTTYYPHRNWYVNLGTNVFKKYTNGPALLSEGFRYDIFTGVSGKIMQGKLNTYSRMRYRENRIESPENVERDPDGVIGLRWYLNRRMEMQLESEFEAQWDDLKTRDLFISRFKYYLDWRPLSRLYFTPGVEFTKTFDKIGPADRNQITLSMNYGHEFRRGFSAFATVRWTKGWGYFNDSFLDLFVNVQKIFHWGRPQMRLGIPRKDQPIVSGTVKGFLFIDENGDRQKQPWEKGIPNIPIILDEGFVASTNANGEFTFDNVLIGMRDIAIDMSALPLEYLPHEIKQKVKVYLRRTTDVYFPVTQAGI
jgi:hypothetical protein